MPRNRHRIAIDALLDAAPGTARERLRTELVDRADAQGISIIKILAALAMAAAGGFSPGAIAAALAMLFGSPPSPAA